MNNYKVLFSLRTLKVVLNNFSDTFLTLYFLQLSESNIVPLGIYKLVEVGVTFLIIFLARNIAKSKHRVSLLRVGIVFDFLYFLSIIVLKEKIVSYIYIVGILRGLEEGFYFSVYNMLESSGITNEQRAKFIGTYSSLSSILSIILPTILGYFIYSNGFVSSISIVLVIIVVSIIVSCFYKDTTLPDSSKTNMKEFYQIAKKDNRIKGIYKLYFFNGLVYSQGPFKNIIMIYIIKVFSDSFSLGIFTSIFNIIASLLGICFAKYLKEKNYSSIITITSIFTIISLCLMIYHCDMFTIVLFNLFQTISKNLTEWINSRAQSNISNIVTIQKNYKVEYWLGNEISLVIARVTGQALFISMGLNISYLWLFMIMFISFYLLYTYHSIKLAKILKEEPVI